MRNKIDKKQIGNRIRNIRIESPKVKNESKKSKPTLEDFAELLDSNKSNVSRWERGLNVPSEETLREIARLGEISIDELLYGSSVKSYIINLLSTDDDYDYNDPIQKKATNDTISCFDDTNLSNAEMNIINVYIQNLNYYEGNSDFRIHDRETYLEFLEISSRSIKEQIQNNPKLEDTNEKIIWHDLSNEEKLLIMENDFERKRNSVLSSIYESNQRLIQKLNRKD